jgi:hypothetical protein
LNMLIFQARSTTMFLQKNTNYRKNPSFLPLAKNPKQARSMLDATSDTARRYLPFDFYILYFTF